MYVYIYIHILYIIISLCISIIIYLDGNRHSPTNSFYKSIVLIFPDHLWNLHLGWPSCSIAEAQDRSARNELRLSRGETRGSWIWKFDSENWWKLMKVLYRCSFKSDNWLNIGLVFEDQGQVSILYVNYGLCTKLQMLLWEIRRFFLVKPSPNGFPGACVWEVAIKPAPKQHPPSAMLRPKTAPHPGQVDKPGDCWSEYIMIYPYISLYNNIYIYIYVYCIHEMLGMHQPCIMSLSIYIYIYM